MKKPYFKFLTGDINWLKYGAKLVSQKQNNGEFDFWFVIEFINMDEACGRDNQCQPRYTAALLVVSPSEAGRDNLANAFECCGLPEDPNLRDNPLVQVEYLSYCGVYAQTWTKSSNNAHQLIREAKREATIQAGCMFGFAMDRPVNRIGTTGWEALRGDLNSALNRVITTGSTEGQILAKMYAASSK
jgi:hypothetical protein